ncbi:hypothetical protein [Streptomyces tanashiensis]|uniref:Lipoprotein n=1 Tax=Streptomyces tanashiensis TaxID=67367 RepID=A0ABY6R400_9ACTN|nr:hypothetical protein [Streptomyces tanashiensis]UZX24124.1 hypothetical protein LDH80_26985 [Streptomyces tanashiensis]
MRGRTSALRRSRSRGALLALALLCAAAAPLAGCSSGGDGGQTPDSDVSTDATATDETDETDETSGTTGETDPEKSEEERQRREKEKDSGSFNRAGRLSNHFGGHWPNAYFWKVTNPSSDPYSGTLSLVDCTPGLPSRPLIPPSQPVTLAPGETSEELTFEFSTEGGNTKPTHQVCTTLSNEAGVSDEASQPVDADLLPPPGQTDGETTEGTTGNNTTGDTSEGTTGDNTTGDTSEGTTGDNTTGDTSEGTTGDNTTGDTSEGTTGSDTDGGSDGSGPSR